MDMNMNMNMTPISNDQDPRPIVYSIRIMRVERNIGNSDVLSIVKQLNLGSVETLEMKPMVDENDEQYWQFNIHFNEWNTDNPQAMLLRAKLDWEINVKLVYDSPKFWIITQCKIPPFLDFTYTEEAIPGQGQNQDQGQDQESDNSKPKSICRIMSKYFKDGQQIRHCIANAKIWIGQYNLANNNIVCDGKIYTSLSGFARAHYLQERPHRNPNANGWVECECEVNAEWISTDKLE
jgi:hypothetical protein